MFTHKKILAALLFAPLSVGCVVEGGDDDDGGAETGTATATQTATQTATVTDTDGTATATQTATVTDTDGTATATATETDATATVTVTVTDTADTGTDTTGDTDTGGGAGFCQQMCAEDLDCCAPGTEEFGCPTDYPFNVTCTANVCEYGGCSGDADCETIAGTTCHDVNGFPSCVPLCTGDGAKECIEGETCDGMTDDGMTFCQFEFPPCETDKDCGGAGVCDLETGICGCTDTAECPKGFECSAG